MGADTLYQYEAMFLFDPTFGANFEACEGEVKRLIDRAGGELLFCRKWEERRLAYRIQGRKRGVYVLTYFRAPGEKIVGFERDAQISENILRLLVLRADHITPELMELSLVQREAPGGDDEGGGDRESRGPRRESWDRDGGGRGGDRPRGPRPAEQRAPVAES